MSALHADRGLDPRFGREAVERAIQALVDLEEHDEAQALIARLDALDGDWELEDGDMDCCSANDDYSSNFAPCDSAWRVNPTHDPDFEPHTRPHVADQRRWTGMPEVVFEVDEDCSA
jgi:hypothetical protein